MKPTAIAALLACLTGAIAACTAVDGSVPSADPAVADTPDAGAATPKDDAAPPDPPPPTSCGGPLAPVTCPSVGPAPTSSTAVASFVKDAAVPLRCGTTPKSSLWDVRPLVDLYGSQQVFMMGEVHGTNEIGILSAIVFEQLARQKLVNVVGYELPMDVTEAFDRWVQTGKDPMAEQYLDYLDPNMFGSILTRTARKLVADGIPVRLVAVDAPQRPSIPLAAIQEVAAKLTTQKDYVLATLPTNISEPPSSADETAVDQYFDHIIAGKTAICSELSTADCERLVAMTHALWVSTFTPFQDKQELWFARREEVIYYNLKTAVPSPSDRLFLHMGAFHTNKQDRSAGSRLAHEYELTKDKVFSVAPAYGDGSVIDYSGHMDLPGEPRTLTNALTDSPPHPVFVSTTRPGKTCEENPFGLEFEDRAINTGTRAATYDGYVHYGLLTPQDEPDTTSFRRDIGVAASAAPSQAASQDRAMAAALRAHLHRVDVKERAALRARALR